MNGPFSVLLVDDSEDDRLFVRRALGKNPAFVLVGEVNDGDQAINYLAGSGDFTDRAKFPYPDVLLLDLKLRGTSGYEVLSWLRDHANGKPRVVVLSGSFLPEDITRCKELGAHAYFKKEAFSDEQQSIVSDMERLLRASSSPSV